MCTTCKFPFISIHVCGFICNVLCLLMKKNICAWLAVSIIDIKAWHTDKCHMCVHICIWSHMLWLRKQKEVFQYKKPNGLFYSKDSKHLSDNAWVETSLFSSLIAHSVRLLLCTTWKYKSLIFTPLLKIIVLCWMPPNSSGELFGVFAFRAV